MQLVKDRSVKKAKLEEEKVHVDTPSSGTLSQRRLQRKPITLTAQSNYAHLIPTLYTALHISPLKSRAYTTSDPRNNVKAALSENAS